MWKKIAAAIAAFYMLGCVRVAPIAAWNRLPLLTESPDIISPGRLDLEIGLHYLSHSNFAFSSFSEHTSRDVLSCPTLGLRIGLGRRSELHLSYDVLFVEEDDFSIREPWKSGDLDIFTKIEFCKERAWRPGMGLNVGVKLPNAGNDYRVGTDETDFAVSALLHKRVATLTTIVNLGLVILGNPFENASQDDLLSYGIACLFPATDAQVMYKAEIVGQCMGTEHNERSSAILSMQMRDSHLTWKLAGRLGLVENSEEWGLSGTVTWHFDGLKEWAIGE